MPSQFSNYVKSVIVVATSLVIGPFAFADDTPWVGNTIVDDAAPPALAQECNEEGCPTEMHADRVALLKNNIADVKARIRQNGVAPVGVLEELAVLEREVNAIDTVIQNSQKRKAAISTRDLAGDSRTSTQVGYNLNMATQRLGVIAEKIGANAAAAKKSFNSESYSTKIAQCERERMVAEECCAHPDRCFTKPDGKDSKNDGAVGAALSVAFGLASSIPANSITAMCGNMRDASIALSGMNAYLGAQCSKYVGSCKDSCEEVANQMEKDGWLNEDKVSNVSEAYRVHAKLMNHSGQCRQFDNASIRLTTQAVALAAQAKLSDMCKKMNPTPNLDTGDLFATGNCSTPSAASTPFCQALCNQAGAASNPQCAGFLEANGGLGNNGGLNGDPDTGASSAENRFSVPDLGDEGTQNPNIADAAQQKLRSSAQMGSGGLSGLGGGGAAGGGEGGAQGPAADGGYNTKIDRGLASGNGYSMSGGLRTGGGGGFSGYGGNGSTAITSAGKPFNLRDFLPDSGAKTPTKLAMRTLASSNADIAPAHTDIFKKVTDRFYQVCLRDGLYDCASLNKKKLGN